MGLTMRRWLWLIVAVVLVLVVPGGVAVVAIASKLTEEQRRVRRELRAAADRHTGTDGRRVPPEVLEVLGYVESPPGKPWRLGARSPPGAADDELGGAFGPTQLTERTARMNGFDGSMDTLGSDAWLSAEWTARCLVAGARNAQGKVLRATPQTVADAAAWWNAGRQSAAELPASHVTRTTYIPRALAALGKVQADPVA